ncbi:hypothetical protein [Saccharolobus shibatae]|uniref:Thermopsin n=3 Tax=Saccharolobus shibatae TaxID=2286 RepID=A0A8F5BZU7_9CREN|nr:hypothetical protein [Saccharolobus shibatae]QXJ28076.1 hypothetical protein J5U23_00944 [Saccharolobus shibatae B12]QXJ31397.1 hypothetical protein J5U21_01047 [Saccharolobus shibatae]QXJ34416.1 hypothetical protein J5U22_00962 [Saccharolobus shibatae]
MLFQKFSIIQVINKTFNNGTVLVGISIISWNTSMQSKFSYSIANSTLPLPFYYVSPLLLGEKNISVSGVNLLYVNSTNSYYVYLGKSNVEGVVIETYFYFNLNGLADKVINLQIGSNGKISSETTLDLWMTNFNNTGIGIPHFKGITTASSEITSSLFPQYSKIMEYIILVGALLVMVILLFRGTKWVR